MRDPRRGRIPWGPPTRNTVGVREACVSCSLSIFASHEIEVATDLKGEPAVPVVLVERCRDFGRVAVFVDEFDLPKGSNSDRKHRREREQRTQTDVCSKTETRFERCIRHLQFS